MPAAIDIAGKRFGKLLVVSVAGKDKHGQLLWNCVCDCGSELVALSGNLRRVNHTTSCGCAKAERFHKENWKHGHTIGGPSREYSSWQGMKNRCLVPSHQGYKNYGGRGIKICDRWLNSFSNFVSDMGERPAKFTLDRIDPDGNYDPSNCRWASWQTQARNKRK